MSGARSPEGGPLLEIGHIGRAHGLRGEVVVGLVSNRDERLQPGARLSTARGELTVSAARRHSTQHIVKFAEIADRTAAEAWRGTALLGEALVDDDVLWVHELIGTTVIEQDGTERGVVVTVIANPASDLLELDSGALVPLTFLVERTGDRLVVDVPDGLFDL